MAAGPTPQDRTQEESPRPDPAPALHIESAEKEHTQARASTHARMHPSQAHTQSQTHMCTLPSTSQVGTWRLSEGKRLAQGHATD